METRDEVLSVLKQMREVAGRSPRFDALSDRMESLVMQNIIPTMDDRFKHLKLQPKQTIIFDLLRAKMGKFVRRDTLMDALYWNAKEPPISNIISVYISHIRKKLRGSGYDIESWWGRGYRLVSASSARPL